MFREEHYEYQNIRLMFSEGYNQDELYQLSYDEPVFQPVYSLLSNKTDKAQLIDLLLAHANQTKQLDFLLLWAAKSKPDIYVKYQPYYRLASNGYTVGLLAFGQIIFLIIFLATFAPGCVKARGQNILTSGADRRTIATPTSVKKEEEESDPFDSSTAQHPIQQQDSSHQLTGSPVNMSPPSPNDYPHLREEESNSSMSCLIVEKEYGNLGTSLVRIHSITSCKVVERESVYIVIHNCVRILNRHLRFQTTDCLISKIALD